MRRVLYTTTALENVHRQLRKIIKTRGLFQTDEAATQLIWRAPLDNALEFTVRAIPGTLHAPLVHLLKKSDRERRLYLNEESESTDTDVKRRE